MTSAAFRDGFYTTGDRAVKDKDDYLWFVGRSDDVIISAGYATFTSLATINVNKR